MSLSGINHFRQFSVVTKLSDDLVSWSQQTDITSEKVLCEVGARAAGLLLIPLAALVDVVAHTLFSVGFLALGVIFLPFQAIVYLFKAEDLAPIFKEMFLTSAFMEVGRTVQFIALLALSPLFALISPRLVNDFSKDFVLAQATNELDQSAENNRNLNNQLAQAAFECRNMLRLGAFGKADNQSRVVFAKLNLLPDSDEKMVLQNAYRALNGVALNPASTNEEFNRVFTELRNLEREIDEEVSKVQCGFEEYRELVEQGLQNGDDSELQQMIVADFLPKVSVVQTLYRTLCEQFDMEFDNELLEQLLKASDEIKEGDNFKEAFANLIEYFDQLDQFVATLVEEAYQKINHLQQELEDSQQQNISYLYQQLNTLQNLLPESERVDVEFDSSQDLQSEYEKAQNLFDEIVQKLGSRPSIQGAELFQKKLLNLKNENSKLQKRNEKLESKLKGRKIENITNDVGNEGRRTVQRQDTEERPIKVEELPNNFSKNNIPPPPPLCPPFSNTMGEENNQSRQSLFAQIQRGTTLRKTDNEAKNPTQKVISLLDQIQQGIQLKSVQKNIEGSDVSDELKQLAKSASSSFFAEQNFDNDEFLQYVARFTGKLSEEDEALIEGIAKLEGESQIQMFAIVEFFKDKLQYPIDELSKSTVNHLNKIEQFVKGPLPRLIAYAIEPGDDDLQEKLFDYFESFQKTLEKKVPQVTYSEVQDDTFDAQEYLRKVIEQANKDFSTQQEIKKKGEEAERRSQERIEREAKEALRRQEEEALKRQEEEQFKGVKDTVQEFICEYTISDEEYNDFNETLSIKDQRIISTICSNSGTFEIAYDLVNNLIDKYADDYNQINGSVVGYFSQTNAQEVKGRLGALLVKSIASNSLDTFKIYLKNYKQCLEDELGRISPVVLAILKKRRA